MVGIRIGIPAGLCALARDAKSSNYSKFPRASSKSDPSALGEKSAQRPRFVGGVYLAPGRRHACEAHWPNAHVYIKNVARLAVVSVHGLEAPHFPRISKPRITTFE
jgi:hypothetical protein